MHTIKATTAFMFLIVHACSDGRGCAHAAPLATIDVDDDESARGDEIAVPAALPTDFTGCVADIRGDTWRRLELAPGRGKFSDTKPHFPSGLWIIEFGAPVRLGSFVYSVGSDCAHFAGVIGAGVPATLISSSHGLPDIEVDDETRCERTVWLFSGFAYEEDKTRTRSCDASAGRVRAN